MKGTGWALALALLGAGSAGAVSTVPETPRYFTFELKLGSYFPLIDSEPGLNGKTPYADTFGPNAGMLRFDADVEKFIYQGWGSVALGLGVGYAEIFAAAHDDTGAISQVKTGLRFYPIRAIALYRFDYLALKQGIPLVPFVKAGLVMQPWSSANGNQLEVANGVNGAGIQWGYFFTGGLSLMIDFLDERLARDFDSEFGVNHTYLFAEFDYEQVDNFGAGGLNLSSRRFMFGLAFDI